MRRPPAHVPPGVSRCWRLARLAVSGTGTSPAGVVGAPLRVWNARHLVAAASLLCSVPGVGAQEPPQRAPADWPQFRSTTVLPFGEPVIPVFEGWIPNPDGTITLSFGYFNLNTEETLHPGSSGRGCFRRLLPVIDAGRVEEGGGSRG